MANRRRRGDGTGAVMRLLQAMFRCAAEPAVLNVKHAAYITSPRTQQQQQQQQQQLTPASSHKVQIWLEVLNSDSLEQDLYVRVHITCLDATPDALQAQPHPCKPAAQALDAGQGKCVELSSVPSKKESSQLLNDSSRDIAHVYALCDSSAKQEAAPFAIASHKPEDHASSPTSTQALPFVYPAGMPFGPASCSDGAAAAPEQESSSSAATTLDKPAVRSHHSRIRSSSNVKSGSFSRIARRVLSWGGEQQLGPIERISSRQHWCRSSKEQQGYERIPDDQEEDHIHLTEQQPLGWLHPTAQSFLDQECICPAGRTLLKEEMSCSKQKHSEQRAGVKLQEHTSDASKGGQMDHFKQQQPPVIHFREHI